MNSLPIHDNKITVEKPVGGFIFVLYITYVISFFLHLAARVPGISEFRPDFVLAIIIMVMLALEFAKFKNRFDNPVQQALLYLLIYIILTIPFVEWPGSVLRENFVTFIKAIVFFYFTILIIDTDKRLRIFVVTFMLCQLFRILEPLYLHEMYDYWGSGTYIGDGHFTHRLSGAPSDIVNPNGLAFVVAMLFPFLYYIFGNSNWLFKVIYYLLIPALLYVMVLTMSRSGFIALAVIIWIIFVRSKHKLLIILAIVGICIFSWGKMTDIQRDRYLSLTGDRETMGAATFYGRLSAFSPSIDVILDRPVFGHGVGTSREAFVNKYGGGQLSHIFYAEIAIEMGIIGFIIYMIFIKRIFNLLHDTRFKVKTLLDKGIENKPYSDNSLNINYYSNLTLSLSACFWMYLIFSLAQYGVSEYHWYLLAGLAVVVYRNINNLFEKHKTLSSEPASLNT